MPAVQCVWHVGKHATRIAYPNARGSLLHVRDDKFVIKVSRQALYPGHTLGGAQSVYCKPELAGSLECCARCVAKRTLAIGITCGHVLATGYWNHRLPGFPGEVVGDRLWRGQRLCPFPARRPGQRRWCQLQCIAWLRSVRIVARGSGLQL